ncbi:hypothetical protein ETD83_03045 [Actinomadura soli]|uniref:Uncharacterized protein n=1 Tax=Actinomadura soli TaxID=2508997 RepID=A0A5C4JJC8_9ACTN|nr:hypothetical protein [Actinomadura soli]TMR06868.1 hypothetical protein ETD83_03045 [Actinomadura soli]
MSLSAQAQHEHKALIRLRDQLVSAYGAQVPAEEIGALIEAAAAKYAAAAVRDFVPLLVERDARAALRRRGRGGVGPAERS